MVAELLSDLTWEELPVAVGSHIKKKLGFKFIGRVLSVYWDAGTWYAVVKLDPNESSDGLQHIYKVSQLERI